MGLLVEGKWQDRWYDTSKTSGRFVRDQSRFRNWIVAPGQAPPSGSAFPAEPGRYHLYVSLACPWAHRTLIFRHLKGLDSLISVSVVHPHMLAQGWTFEQYPADPYQGGDPLNSKHFLHQIYSQCEPTYSGRVTVPVLWDRKESTIVSNESAEIIRMLNSAFNHITGNQADFYPEPLRPAIDEINEEVYANVNNGVYRCGFATTQQAYEEAFSSLFGTLDRLEDRLGRQRYLAGKSITEADWRLFTTLVRFDAVYYCHFKTNLRRISEYPHLGNYLRELYQWPGIAKTVNLQHIKQHYYYSHATINPHRIVPIGPRLQFDQAHDRDMLSEGTA